MGLYLGGAKLNESIYFVDGHEDRVLDFSGRLLLLHDVDFKTAPRHNHIVSVV